MTAKKTDAQFKEDLKRVHGNTITTDSVYDGSKMHLKLKCVKCKHVWEAVPANVLGGTGCPKCNIGGSSGKTHAEFLIKLHDVHGKGIIPLEPYVFAKTLMKVKCAKCGHRWKATPNNLTSGKGCPARCGMGPRCSQEEFEGRLLEVHKGSVISCEPYRGILTALKFKCEACENEWVAAPNHVLNTATGCPACNKGATPRHTDEHFKLHMNRIKSNVTVLGTYITANTKIDVICNDCGREWQSRPNDLLQGKGCKVCGVYKAFVNSHKQKHVTVGKYSFRLMGYEPSALDHFLENGINPKDIKTNKEVPRFDYTMLSDGVRKPHRYYPDFYLPKTNTVVEIKSTWTMSGIRQWFVKLKAKRKAVLEAGYNFELLVYKAEGIRFMPPDDWYAMTYNFYKEYHG